MVSFLVKTVVLLVALLGAQLLLWPIGIYLTHRRRLEGIEELDPDVADLPATVAEFLDAAIEHLAALGFEVVGYLRQGDSILSYFVLLIGPAPGESAAAIAIDEPLAHRRYIELATGFVDDTQIHTFNSDGPLGSLAGDPKRRLLRFPWVGSPELLLALHRAAVDRFADARPRQRDAANQLLEAYLEQVKLIYEYQVKAGVMRRLEGGKVYAPTARGAVAMAWKNSIPAYQIRGWLEERKMRRLFASLVAAAGIDLGKYESLR